MPHTLPLQNTAIVVTRPSHQSRKICQQLSDFGATTIPFPCIEIHSNPQINATAIHQQLMHCQILVFVSSNAVDQLFSLVPNLQDIVPETCLICALGSATASSLHQFGIQQVEQPSSGYDSEQLLKHPKLQNIDKKMTLIIKGVGGRELLYETFQDRGAEVHNLEVYQRRLPEPVDIKPLTNKIDLILFTSSETVNNFLTITPGSLQKSLLGCQTLVGHPRIAEKVSSLGFKKLPIIAATPSDADMLDAALQWAQNDKK